MDKRLFLIAAFSAATFACGDDTGSGSNNGGTDNNTSNNTTNNDTGGGSNNGPNNNDGAACPTVGDGQTFAEHDDLFFDFDHPSGWELIDETRGSNSLLLWIESPGRTTSPPRIPFEVSVSQVPVSDPDLWASQREGGYPERMTAEYDGETIDVMAMNYELGDVITMFLLPYDGNHYQVSTVIKYDEGCRDGAFEVTEMFFDSLAPNPDTTFEPVVE